MWCGHQRRGAAQSGKLLRWCVHHDYVYVTCSSSYSELVPSALCKSGVCPCEVEGEQRDDGGREEERRGEERRRNRR